MIKKINFNKLLRRFGLVILLFLVMIGISIAGGVPLVSHKKRKNKEEALIELVDFDLGEEEENLRK